MPNVTSGNVITDTAQIAAGVIVNDDVSATAAIAYSKLNLGTSIVNADVSTTAAIVDTKLATISTAGKVSGAALTSLGSIPAGGGSVPNANIAALPALGTSPSPPRQTAIVNSEIDGAAAIADTKLAQITTASKVSGAALTSLASVPAGAGLLPSANTAPDPDRSVKLTANAAISISNNSETTISWNTETFDTDSMHEGVTNPSRITFTTAGKYFVGGNTSWASNATGRRQTTIRVNGTTVIARTAILAQGSGASTEYETSTIFNAAANDYAEVLVFQDSGGALNFQASPPADFWAFQTRG